MTKACHRPENPLIRRLRLHTNLAEGDLLALADLFGGSRMVAAGRTIAVEHERPNRLHLLIDGWAAHSKLLPSGQRHLPTLLIPGDLCDTDALYVQRLDYAIVTLTPCEVATADRDALAALVRDRPALGGALTWFSFVERSCELAVRLEAVGLASETGYLPPITQEALVPAAA